MLRFRKLRVSMWQSAVSNITSQSNRPIPSLEIYLFLIGCFDNDTNRHIQSAITWEWADV